MRISVDANARHIKPAMDWIGGLIGAAVDKRVAAFKKQKQNNPLLATHFQDNFALDFALANARKYRKNRRRAI